MLKHAIDLNKYKNRDQRENYHPEYQYLNLLTDILNEGTLEEGRNGNVKTTIGSVMHFPLTNKQIPIMTTKKTAWKVIIKELLFFIKGQTDNKILTDQDVHIWDGNTTQQFLESRGLSHYEVGRDIGPMYGFQWCHFNAPYQGCTANYKDKGINQLKTMIENLKDPKERFSRRHIVTAWNPEQLDDGVLPPCHILFQMHVTDTNKLCCTLYQRSCDEFLGIPFNIASYSILTCIIAKMCDLEPYEFIHYGGNCHIYDDHFEQIKEQISREPYHFPTLEILNKHDNIDDYVLEDFVVTNYQHHPPIKGNMRA